VREVTVPTPDRRVGPRGDRRKNPRSGRRATDPHTNWRRLAWLIAAYGTYLSVRSLLVMMKNSLPDIVKRAVPEQVKASVKKLFRGGPIQPT
jgi:hypothetical protein